MGKLALVTGGTGFAGSHLCRRLMSEGFAVRALVRRDGLQDGLRNQGIEPILGDVREPESLEAALRGVDTVYHLAAAFRPGRLSRRALYDTNVSGTANIVRAAVRARVGRFVHCSSVGVHGEIRHPPADEDAPFRPGDAYQESKLQGELVARQLAVIHRLPLVVVRPAGIYGPGDLRFLKLVKAVRQPVFPMIGSGRVLYQMVFIDDLVDGFLKAGTVEAAVGKAFILTGREAVTLNELVSTLAGVLGKKLRIVRIPVAPVYLLSMAVEFACAPFGLEPPLFRRRLDVFRKDRAFAIAKAKRHLGYDPKVGLRVGFERAIDWYRQQDLIG